MEAGASRATFPTLFREEFKHGGVISGIANNFKVLDAVCQAGDFPFGIPAVAQQKSLPGAEEWHDQVHQLRSHLQL